MSKRPNRILHIVMASSFAGIAAIGCNRQESPPVPPRAMVNNPAATEPDTGRSAIPPPAGSPGTPSASLDPNAPGSAAMPERGMSGVAGSTAAANAANPSAGMAASPMGGPVAGSDRAFISEAANNGLAEIEASRLVVARTDNSSVKSLAQHMEQEHASANDELKRIAAQKGIELPNTIGGDPRGQLSRLTTLSKPELDQTYVRDFGIDAHKKAISLFERQAREGQDADLKAFAERTLPRLRDHLSMAQQMQAQVGGAAGQAGPMGSESR